MMERMKNLGMSSIHKRNKNTWQRNDGKNEELRMSCVLMRNKNMWQRNDGKNEESRMSCILMRNINMWQRNDGKNEESWLEFHHQEKQKHVTEEWWKEWRISAWARSIRETKTRGRGMMDRMKNLGLSSVHNRNKNTWQRNDGKNEESRLELRP